VKVPNNTNGDVIPSAQIKIAGNLPMSHEQFIAKLKYLGFNIEAHISPAGSSDLRLYLNGIEISISDYTMFGYVCAGTYAQCIRTDKTEFLIEDLELAIITCSDTLMSNYVYQYETVKFFDVIKYLRTYDKPKIGQIAVKRMLTVLEEGYQNMFASVRKFVPFD